MSLNSHVAVRNGVRTTIAVLFTFAGACLCALIPTGNVNITPEAATDVHKQYWFSPLIFDLENTDKLYDT